MVDAIEELAVTAMALAAAAEDGLDDLEDGLFRFGRVVAGQPDLRAALADPSLPENGKRELLDTLLRGKVTPVTLAVISQMVAHPRGRSIDAGPGPVRRHRGAAPGAADRGGPFGDRAVRHPAPGGSRRRWPSPTGTTFT